MTIIYQRKSNKRLLNIQIDFLFRVSYAKKGWAIGTYSICKDGRHIIYLDYDNFRFEWLIEELKFLRDKYKLSDFYIFRSSGNAGKYKHHAVCFDKVTAKIYNNIVQDTNSDMLFKNNGMFDLENARVLRFSGKVNSNIAMPYLYGTLRSKYHKKQKSSAHINFYKSVFKITDGVINESGLDGSDGLRVISYATKNI